MRGLRKTLPKQSSHIIASLSKNNYSENIYHKQDTFNGDKQSSYNLKPFKTSFVTASLNVTKPLMESKQSNNIFNNSSFVTPFDDSTKSENVQTTTTLNPTEYKKWTKEEAVSLLCAPDEVGGAGLTVERVKPLYDANFDGTSIDNIINIIYIKKKDEFFAIEEGCKDFPDVPRTTIKSVVFWVDKLLKTRLYHLWSIDKIKEELCKPIDEGGIGTTMNELSNLNSKDELFDKENTQYKKLSLWKDRKCFLNIEMIAFEDDPFLLKLLKEKIDSEKIYEKCLIEFMKRKHIQPNIAFLDDILSYTQRFEVNTLQSVAEIPPTIENILHKNLHPLFKNRLGFSNNCFNKQYLPYIESLHFGNPITMATSGTQSNIIISPSGIGKTARMVKAMCKIPGIYTIGTTKSETDSGQTSDKCVKTLLDFLPKNRFEAFACVKQLIQLLLITKLLHVLRVIDEVSINTSLLDPFEGNIFAFIAFNQANGNTKMESEVYSKLVSEYIYCEIDILRRLTASLIQKVIIQLKKLQNVSTHEWNGKSFVICLDEAHILEEKSDHKFISLQGRQRGLLSVFVSEIELLKDKVAYPYNLSSAYAGTSFNVDVSNIVQSAAQKTEANPEINIITHINYLSKEDFIKFLSLHITLSEEMKENVKVIPDSMFPIRIRQAAYTLQLYLEKENEKQLSDCFEEAYKELTKYITKLLIPVYEENKSKELISSAICSSLLNYCFHNKFHEHVGYSFYENNKIVADMLLRSGLTCPSDNTFNKFEAKDPIGLFVAKKLLSVFEKETKHLDIDIDSLTLVDVCNFLLQRTNDRNETDNILGLAFIEQNGKLLGELFKVEEKFKNVKFQCTNLCTAEMFKQICIDNKWVDIDCKENGEELFFRFVKDRQWDRIYGIAFLPSKEVHSDIILFMPGINGSPINLNFSLKLQFGEKREFMSGYFSTIPSLYYVNHYTKLLDFPEALTKINSLVPHSYNSYNDFRNYLLTLVPPKKVSEDVLKTYFTSKNTFWTNNFKQIMESYGMVNIFSVIMHLNISKNKPEEKINTTSTIDVNINNVQSFCGIKFKNAIITFLKDKQNSMKK